MFKMVPMGTLPKNRDHVGHTEDVGCWVIMLVSGYSFQQGFNISVHYYKRFLAYYQCLKTEKYNIRRLIVEFV